MNRQIRALSLIGLSVILAFQQAATALAQDGPPPKDRYIIVLKPAKAGVPELTDHDITAGGGKVEYKVPGRVQVTLPEQAVDAIRKHGAVKYIQKVILGPLPDASAPAELRLTPRTSSLHVAAEATPPAWKSGTYQYDASGNIYAIGGVTGDGSTVSHRYAYDELSRLKQSDTITATTQTQTFTYDQYGNLTQRQIVGLDPVVTPVETTNTNRLLPVSGHPYVYDAAGNLTADYNLAYAYDPFNMLREKDSGIYLSKSEYYIYTASDERIGVAYGHMSDSPTIWSIRDFGGNVLRQYESHDQQNGMAWLWVEDYVYRGGQLLAGERVPEEGGRRHFHLDHLGSPRLVTGQDSKEMSEHDYEPFGLESNPLYQETAGGFDREDPKRFTGHERDYAPPGESPASTAYLDYMHARYYSSNVGRFLSVDPGKDWDPRQPQSWNMYTYARNNPLTLTDPTGMFLDFLFEGGATAQDMEKFVNSHLYGETAKVDSNTGNLTLTPNNAVGPPTPEQKAFSDTLHAAVDRQETVTMTVTNGDSSVRVGQYPTGKVDLADVNKFRGSGAGSAASVFAHEVAEQTAKQVFHLPNTTPGFDLAHSFGSAAQSYVAGYTRGATIGRLDASGTGVLTTLHTNASGQTVLVTAVFQNGNVVRVQYR